MAQSRNSRAFPRAGAFALAALAFAGCQKPGLTAAEVNGVVVNAASSQPLAGANVLVVWEGEVDVLVDSQVVRVRHCKTVTSVDGTFSVAAWRAPRNVIGSLKAQAFVYLPGYIARPLDSAQDHTGPEAVTHSLYAIVAGESAASNGPDFSLEKDCADGFAIAGDAA